VTDPCTVRIPDYFLVTVMSTDEMIIKTVQHPVTSIRVTLPQNVDECDLIVRVSAVNSAGISSPTEETTNGKLIYISVIWSCSYEVFGTYFLP